MADLIPRGMAYWQNIQQVISATFTVSHGIRPSVCIMEIAPQDPNGITEYGTLVFGFGLVNLVFPGCKIDKASFQYGPSGLIWSFSIWDRRWKWEHGAVSGHWNERHSGVGITRVDLNNFGAIDPKTEKTPQQLAEILLREMGEKTWDVTQLPNLARPEVIWEADNPAQMLQQLVECLGCRICIGIDNVTRVVRTGVGALLPDNDLMQTSAVVDLPEIPDSITVIGGKAKYQASFLLEAVGRDVDGVIKKIDDLSYKPAAGWSKVNLRFWDMVPGWEPNPLVPPNLQRARDLGRINPRELARETVFKWYRIAMGDGNPALFPLIPEWGGAEDSRIRNLWQILPLLNEQVEGWYDVLGLFHPYEPWVFGTFWDIAKPGARPGALRAGNSNPGDFCHLDFRVNTEEGLVEFADYCYKKDANGTFVPADLYLRIAVNVKEEATRTDTRASVDRDLPVLQRDTGPRIIKREEIVGWVVPEYDADHAVAKITTNQRFVEEEGNYYIDAALAEYQLAIPQDRTYMGLLPISLDGAIQQITWVVGPGGATTRASRNTEWNPAIPNYRERIVLAAMRKQGPVVQQILDQQRKGR